MPELFEDKPINEETLAAIGFQWMVSLEEGYLDVYGYIRRRPGVLVYIQLDTSGHNPGYAPVRVVNFNSGERMFFPSVKSIGGLITILNSL